ncbi:DUF6163 family protein [Ciceribacter sp. L1K22]|uniref:DUF6163 family protein n=1 Tax=Ciceribacter sp. L1K22 TaxID=2820275 RepID=UPI001ABDDAA1|nr:DUF6163 family protein [Ciceribacter sp. L1K22]MBO3759765.1 hypothetical protein [Ciceribacter sp. L1K22]
MDDDSSHLPQATLTGKLFLVFLRVVAVTCLWFGLQYWAMLVGYSLGGHGRFDLLTVPWQIASASLAVVFPVAALGLWLAGSWGPVIWVLAAGTQIAMYGFWTDIYGVNRLVIVMHCVVAIVYIIFRAAIWLEGRERPQLNKV